MHARGGATKVKSHSGREVKRPERFNREALIRDVRVSEKGKS